MRMSIITGRGDSGETDLLFGKRIPKGSLRVECLGAVDELNAALGVARAETTEGDWVELVDKIQAKLVGLMGQLAVLPEDEEQYLEKGYAMIADEDVEWLKDEAQAYEKRGVPNARSGHSMKVGKRCRKPCVCSSTAYRICCGFWPGLSLRAIDAGASMGSHLPRCPPNPSLPHPR